jgi:hypothetical protein
MFTDKNPTVFILGAGASWHYGYPTGEELVKRVIEKAKCASTYFQHSTTTANEQQPLFLEGTLDPSLEMRWQAALDQCNALRAGLEQVKPLVIDYYLGWNPRLQSIGRLLITWVILECEQNYLKLGGNINQKNKLLNSPLGPERVAALDCDVTRYNDDWCRFVIHKLVINSEASSDLLKNDVSFVTFNYDVSLELALHRGLRHIELFQEADVSKFLGGDRILHIYGKVRDVPPIETHALNYPHSAPANPPEAELPSYQSEAKVFYDTIYNASKGLRVIDPKDKETNRQVIEAAREVIERAKCVYILGYGFDENNSARLNLPRSL